MDFIKKLFGGKTKRERVSEFLEQGAVIVDVRTPGEFKAGHVDGAKNIPLQQIDSRVEEFKKWKKPVILCCASGMRSGQAAHILKGHGIECLNGGPWGQVRNFVLTQA